MLCPPFFEAFGTHINRLQSNAWCNPRHAILPLALQLRSMSHNVDLVKKARGLFISNAISICFSFCRVGPWSLSIYYTHKGHGVINIPQHHLPAAASQACKHTVWLSPTFSLMYSPPFSMSSLLTAVSIRVKH